MNRKLLLAAGLSILMVAGCSSAPAQNSTTPSSTAPSASTESKASTSTNASTKKTESATSAKESVSATTPVTVAPDYDKVRTAITNAGFTIQEEDVDHDDYSADLINNSGTVEISVEYELNASAARNEYKKELDDEQHDGYQQVNTYSDTDNEMTVLLNDVNNLYTLIGVNDTTGEVVQIEDILEPNKDACLGIMKELGFKTAE